MMPPILAFLVASLAMPVKALEVEGGFSREQLSGGRADWTSAYLEGAHTFAERQTLYGIARRSSRFDLRDTEYLAGYYHPLGRRWTALVEGNASPDHRVLPKHSLLGQLSWQAGGGWTLSPGVRYTKYTTSSTRLLIGTLERYWSTFRAAYTLYNGRPEGAGSATAHRLAFEHFYTERSRVGIGFTRGREVENVGPPIGITSTDVRSVNLYGRHWLTPAWALTWEGLRHDQGDIYRRQGFRLGLRHRF